MKQTKIEWCDSTWNPVTGCLHGCEYCYARQIAHRFEGCDKFSTYGAYHQATWKRVNPQSELKDAIFEVYAKCPPKNVRFDTQKQKAIITKAPYPWGFQPTMRYDRLEQPQQWKNPRNIFVCSMADLFGEWVPNEWIEQVFAACEAAPQHNYLFLTKNPKRYLSLALAGKLPASSNMWFGSTVTTSKNAFFSSGKYKTFLSVEPLHSDIDIDGIQLIGISWIVIGAETGKHTNKITPKKEWVDSIVKSFDLLKRPIFMKDSLVPIVGEQNMRRDFPAELRKA